MTARARVAQLLAARRRRRAGRPGLPENVRPLLGGLAVLAAVVPLGAWGAAAWLAWLAGR